MGVRYISRGFGARPYRQRAESEGGGTGAELKEVLGNRFGRAAIGFGRTAMVLRLKETLGGGLSRFCTGTEG